MSSVPLPNKSDTDRTAVDSISKQSGDGTEGTVDSSLNKAPRQPFDDLWSVPDFAIHWPQQDIDLLKEMLWQSYQCGYFESLCDGQPGQR